jgi:hypothetical protein
MKEVLMEFTTLTGLYVAENGDWYFEEPKHIETKFIKKADILKTK